jgi:hypothetical protein
VLSKMAEQRLISSMFSRICRSIEISQTLGT